MEEFTEREKQKFGDIWVRARHNAMAHLISSRKSERKAFWIDAIAAIFILIPIGSAFILPLGKISVNYLATISLVGSLGALFLTLIGPAQKFKKVILSHKYARSLYASIAQKARRGDNPHITSDEKKYLLRSLEEMFETAKYGSEEPSDKDFNEASLLMKNMKRVPFDIDINE
jgi:hypothetical protein